MTMQDVTCRGDLVEVSNNSVGKHMSEGGICANEVGELWDEICLLKCVFSDSVVVKRWWGVYRSELTDCSIKDASQMTSRVSLRLGDGGAGKVCVQVVP